MFALLTTNCFAQDSLVNEFHLTSKSKTKTIRSSSDITIISGWRWKPDSSKIDIEPQYEKAFYLSNDTFIIRPSRVYHQLYRMPTDNKFLTITDYKVNDTNKVKLPISDIVKIKVKRKFIILPTFFIGYAALTSAVLVAPIVSIDKKFNIDRYKKVAGYSLALATTMLTINLAFGTKTYHIKQYKNRKTWALK